jgi:hypothetical protein
MKMATFRVEGLYRSSPTAKSRSVILYLEHPDETGLGVSEHTCNALFPESRNDGKNYTETLREKKFKLISVVRVVGSKKEIKALKAGEASKAKKNATLINAF